MNLLSRTREELFSEARRMTGFDNASGCLDGSIYGKLYRDWLDSDTTYNFVAITNILIDSIRGLIESKGLREVRELKLLRRRPL